MNSWDSLTILQKVDLLARIEVVAGDIPKLYNYAMRAMSRFRKVIREVEYEKKSEDYYLVRLSFQWDMLDKQLRNAQLPADLLRFVEQLLMNRVLIEDWNAELEAEMPLLSELKERYGRNVLINVMMDSIRRHGVTATQQWMANYLEKLESQ